MEIRKDYKYFELMDKLFLYFYSNHQEENEKILYNIISFLEIPYFSHEEYKSRSFMLIAYQHRIHNIFKISHLESKAKFQKALGQFIYATDFKSKTITEMLLQLYKPVIDNPHLKINVSTIDTSASTISTNMLCISQEITKKVIVNENEMKIENLIQNVHKRKFLSEFIQETVASDGVNALFSFSESIFKHMNNISFQFKLKFLTLYSKLFFLFSDKQKKNLIEKFNQNFFLCNSTELDPASVNNIQRNILSLNKSLPIDELLLEFLTKKKINIELVQKKIYDIHTRENIKDLYFIYCLHQTYHYFELSEDSQILYAQLSFILYFSLTRFEVFDEENQYQFLCDLYIIQQYYSNLSDKFEYFLENQKGEIVYQQLNFSRPIVGNIDFGSLFTQQDKEFTLQILDRIKYFYKIDYSNQRRLVCMQNFEFTMKIVELIFMKRKYIYSNIPEYQNNLISLEKQLYDNYKQTTGVSGNTILTHTIPKFLKQTFNELNDNLQLSMKTFCSRCDITFTLYPFGSITQFLGGPESDLDIYLELNTLQQSHRIEFLELLIFHLKSIDRNVFNLNTQRLCLITFHFKGVKIDLSYFGIFPVLHSMLLRTYALIDIRFPILASNIKKIIKKLAIFCTEKEKKYLNSFSWMMLLITFLQDIVNPPVLPRLLECSEKKTLKFEVNGLKKRSLRGKKDNSIKDIIENCILRDFDITQSFVENYSDIYTQFLVKKNEMSLSELLLQFLEFIIFYFKYDAIFLHCSFGGESFMNLSKIAHTGTDSAFQNVYGKFNNTRMKKPRGDFLIREPFDNTYNPAQSMVNIQTKELIETLKKFYFSLIKSGKLFN